MDAGGAAACSTSAPATPCMRKQTMIIQLQAPAHGRVVSVMRALSFANAPAPRGYPCHCAAGAPGAALRTGQQH